MQGRKACSQCWQAVSESGRSTFWDGDVRGDARSSDKGRWKRHMEVVFGRRKEMCCLIAQANSYKGDEPWAHRCTKYSESLQFPPMPDRGSNNNLVVHGCQKLKLGYPPAETKRNKMRGTKEIRALCPCGLMRYRDPVNSCEDIHAVQ
jgi:hypothetical protein